MIDAHALEATLGLGMLGMSMLSVAVAVPINLRWIAAMTAGMFFVLAVFAATGIEVKA